MGIAITMGRVSLRVYTYARVYVPALLLYSAIRTSASLSVSPLLFLPPFPRSVHLAPLLPPPLRLLPLLRSLLHSPPEPSSPPFFFLDIAPSGHDPDLT